MCQRCWWFAAVVVHAITYHVFLCGCNVLLGGDGGLQRIVKLRGQLKDADLRSRKEYNRHTIWSVAARGTHARSHSGHFPGPSPHDAPHNRQAHSSTP